MKNNLVFVIAFFFMVFLVPFSAMSSSKVKTIPLTDLKDKIAGGWAGKMIGVTYGAPTEFRAQAKTYEDSIRWKPSDVKGSIGQDDIYVQLTFLMTMDQYGMEAPIKKFQENFARAGFPLWHANIQARKNYFDNIFPPQSGHPDFNLHADDIDFQIEADYIGFMSPGMPQTSNHFADRIGHIMNYGDGVYGGAFVSALYSAAFFENDIPKIIDKALLSIPAKSDYSKIVRDVILLHKHYPDNWRAAWAELEAKWGKVHICTSGSTFNIDAKLNGAYIVMGLLYGEGDPRKTMEITTRCGQDSDCNPSNAMALLGVIKGFNGLPESWQEAVKAIKDSVFINTSYSFDKAVNKTLDYAVRLAKQNGGKISENKLEIKTEQPKALPFEVSFPKLVFEKRIPVSEGKYWGIKGNWENNDKDSNKENKKPIISSGHAGDEISLTFEGTGISLVGNWVKNGGKADVFVDNRFQRTIDCYFHYSGQEQGSMDLYHILNLPQGQHTLRVVVKGEKRPESQGTNVYLKEAVIFKTADKINENYKFSFQ